MNETSGISRRDFLRLFLGSGVLIGCGAINSLLAQELKYTITPVFKSAVNLKTNSNLEEIMEAYLIKMKREGILLDDERLAYNVYDFQTKEKIIGINDTEAFQAASMMKPFVALAFFQKLAETGLNYDHKLRQYMRLMIEKSNNLATNKLMAFLGGPEKIEKILRDNYSSIFKQTKIVEYIPDKGRTYLNKASAEDYSRFLYALWTNSLPFSDEIKHHMERTSKGRLYEGTHIPRGTEVYNKTGTTAMLYGDMGIFNILNYNGTKKAYSLVAMVERKNRISEKESGLWKLRKKELLRGVSDIVYTEMKSRRYDLV